MNLLGNILWLIFGGVWIALTHLFFGILLAITIIGLPFARQHFKLMSLSFTPFGKEVFLGKRVIKAQIDRVSAESP